MPRPENPKNPDSPVFVKDVNQIDIYPTKHVHYRPDGSPPKYLDKDGNEFLGSKEEAETYFKTSMPTKNIVVHNTPRSRPRQIKK